MPFKRDSSVNDYPRKTYAVWAGNPSGTPYDPTRCAESVSRNYVNEQCSRRRGHGPGELFCKQHAKWHVTASEERVHEK